MCVVLREEKCEQKKLASTDMSVCLGVFARTGDVFVRSSSGLCGDKSETQASFFLQPPWQDVFRASSAFPA